MSVLWCLGVGVEVTNEMKENECYQPVKDIEMAGMGNWDIVIYITVIRSIRWDFNDCAMDQQLNTRGFRKYIAVLK